MSSPTATEPKERWEAEISCITICIHECRELVRHLRGRVHFILRPDNTVKEDAPEQPPDVPGDVCPLVASLSVVHTEINKLIGDLQELQSRIDD
jgi:hypothetical protein